MYSPNGTSLRLAYPGNFSSPAAVITNAPLYQRSSGLPRFSIESEPRSMGAFDLAAKEPTKSFMRSSPRTAQGVVDSGQTIRSGRLEAAASVVSCRTRAMSAPRAGFHFTSCGIAGCTSAIRANGSVVRFLPNVSRMWMQRHASSRNNARKNSWLRFLRPVSPSRKSLCA